MQNFGFKKAERNAIKASAEDLVQKKNINLSSYYETSFPLVYEAQLKGVSCLGWLKENKRMIEDALEVHGTILFRGFEIENDSIFESCANVFTNKMTEYTHRSTPRKNVSGKVYTSTIYPSDRSIVMHSECSWTNEWPLRLWFYCSIPPLENGETPIADTRVIYEKIDPEIREKFEALGVMYVRNYHEGIDLPWQEVFDTESKEIVEAYCKRIGMHFEWKENGKLLSTRQVCQAVAMHPKTLEKVWFNQAHLFHISAYKESFDLLQQVFEVDAMPRNTYFGDGSTISSDIVEHINEVYDKYSVAFPWKQNDLLMLDNMLSAHGRRPYVGQRRILAAMSDPYHATNGYLK